MRPVQFDAVEAHVACVDGGRHPRLAQRVEIGFGEFASQAGPVQSDSGRAGGGHVGIQAGLRTAFDTQVPELRDDLPALVVDRVHHRFPGREAVRSVEPRHPGVRSGRRVGNVRPLGDDESDAASRTPPVVGRDIVPGNAAGEKALVMGAIAKRFRSLRDLTANDSKRPSTGSGVSVMPVCN